MFDANNKPLKTGDTVSVSCTIVTPAPKPGLASLLRMAIPDSEGRQPELYLEDEQFDAVAGIEAVVKCTVFNAEQHQNGPNLALVVLTPDKTGDRKWLAVNSRQVTKD